ncbi:MAG: uroporphyrinogen decarboxylase family protein [Verrucomicrobia bacterium]|jgi:uroporphyrinogen decarboxylase|nr:uroporphyrinogen decarboxylase family protein [Verrucomicrobiota bacterium]
MTGRERMLKTLRFEQPDRPPHFETMFELEYEAFGLRFPDRHSWAGMSAGQKDRAIGQCMEIYQRIVERYQWDALAVYWPWSDPDGVRAARKTFGDSILIGSIVGDSIWSIENIKDWTEFAIELKEEPENIHASTREKTRHAIAKFDRLAEAGADFVHLVNDVAYNTGPFVSPADFREFMLPYLAEQVAHIRQRGMIPFVHTDGNIMPILDDYLSLGAACFQSVDPMAGMDIAEVKRRCYGRMALMGNVQCSLLQEGPDEAIRQSALYCLENASPGGGYIFGTSNTIFPGMPLRNYEYMLEVFREFCARHAPSALGSLNARSKPEPLQG